MNCSSCQHCGWCYMTSLDGQGVYKVAFCQVEIVNPVVVDGGAERECLNYEKGEPCE